MDQRYIRNIGALSEEEFAAIQSKKVFVAGCGGLGGHIIDMLLRVGVGGIGVCDGDVFEESNLNRQLLSDTGNIGLSKAEAAAEYAKSVNPGVSFSAYSEFLTDKNAARLLEGCDAAIDALDNIPARRILKAECDRRGIPYIYGAIHGWSCQCAVSAPNDGFIDSIYPTDAAIADKSSLAFTPAICASMQTALCIKLLCGREVRFGKLYYFDLSYMELAEML